MEMVRLGGNVSDVISSTLARADIRIAQGRLHAALRIYEQAVQAATRPGEPILLGTADLYVGVGELHCERNDLNAAMQQLRWSQELSERTNLPQDLYRWCVAMARIRRTHGDLDGALDLLNEAERLYRRDFFPNVRPVAALKTRVWASQGRLGEALGWVREQALSADDDLSYLREFEHITLARVLLARYQSDRAAQSLRDAMALLARLLRAAQEGGRTGSVVEILLLQALAHQAQGDLSAALRPLQQALTLAEPEGYVRIFVDEGPALATLLAAAVTRQIVPTYATKLLAACEGEQPTHARPGARPTRAVPQPPIDPLSEPLSERELEVLRLFATELSGPEIAEQLVIALSTVRTHTKGIYSKLNVNSRREAVKRAEALNLI
jgi:LuxR family maltose regulon positive regulatory protein